MSLDEILRKITIDGIRYVRFEFLDTNGTARSKTIPARHFEEFAKHGISFPIALFFIDPLGNVATESDPGKRYRYIDMTMVPDLGTFVTLPWAKGTARVYVSGETVVANGDRVTCDPRVILLDQLKALEDRGLSIFSSFEYEFFIVDGKTRKPITDGGSVLGTLVLARHREFFERVSDDLLSAGVDVECLEAEYAAGQFEIPMQPAFGVRAADNAATLRTGVKEMALQEGLIASFMTKPYEEEEGCSGHLNHSLWSLDGKTSKMGDSSRPYGLSEIAEHWVAGLLAHAPALSFLQSPTLNCRRRFKQGSFAPFDASWGMDNRTCAVRVKGIGPKGGYIENRIGSSAGNPYLSLAAMIAAGVDGIDRKLAIPPPKSFNQDAEVGDGTEVLPTELVDAIEAVTSDQVMMKAIGRDLVSAIEHMRRGEEEFISGRDQFESHRKLYFDKI